ncbi:HlyD family efflux transporter periplasmic adaptor subunit [Spirosoma sp. SC4-14]|uniref:HlyD family secretion protein n=1 Tax=Spirosoma sp. SC4-14 TaxID=3128900 RepID=UPI0030D4F22C
MQHQLFPVEIVENTLEAYLPRVHRQSQLLYTLVLVSLLGAMLALPFVYVDVSVTSPGLLRTEQEKTEVRPLVAGTVTRITVRENQYIYKGQPLVFLQTHVLDTKLRLNQDQQSEKLIFLHDLDRLVKLDSAHLFSLTDLSSSLYMQQYSQFRYSLTEMLDHQNKVRKELDADRKLYHDKVIAMREFDEKAYAYRRLQTEYSTFIEKQLSQWQLDRNRYRAELTELQAHERQLEEEKRPYTLHAPISGHIQQWSGKYVGSYIQAGENLGIISPDSALLVECHVSSKDIGLLRINMPVQFQIDAFNYNEWGLVSGKLVDIANDFVVVDNNPIYKVKCRLDNEIIRLKNGAQGHLKKGMTLKARFIITRRSLFQLLYDKTDDWLNPKNTIV